jgi:gas vesicle protein
MLTYLLALAVGLGSLGLYIASFALPEINRKNDLIWSGVGLFYALVLWVCAGRITGGVLLGQMAGVALIGWLGWQVVQTRWDAIPPEQRQNNQTGKRIQTFVQSDTVAKLKDQAQQTLSQVQEKVKDVAATQSGSSASPSATTTVEKPLTPEDFGNPPIHSTAKSDAGSAVESSIAAASATEKPNPLNSILGSAKSFIEGLKAPKNTSTYVRKDFQKATSDDDQDFDFGNVAEKVTEKVKGQVDSLKETIETVAETVVDQVTDTADTVVDQVEQLTERATQAVQEGVAEVTPERVVETVEAMAEKAADAVTENATEVAEAIAEGVETVEELVEEADVPLQLKRPEPPQDA